MKIVSYLILLISLFLYSDHLLAMNGGQSVTHSGSHHSFRALYIPGIRFDKNTGSSHSFWALCTREIYFGENTGSSISVFVLLARSVTLNNKDGSNVNVSSLSPLAALGFFTAGLLAYPAAKYIWNWARSR